MNSNNTFEKHNADGYFDSLANDLSQEEAIIYFGFKEHLYSYCNANNEVASHMQDRAIAIKQFSRDFYACISHNRNNPSIWPLKQMDMVNAMTMHADPDKFILHNNTLTKDNSGHLFFLEIIEPVALKYFVTPWMYNPYIDYLLLFIGVYFELECTAKGYSTQNKDIKNISYLLSILILLTSYYTFGIYLFVFVLIFMLIYFVPITILSRYIYFIAFWDRFLITKIPDFSKEAPYISTVFMNINCMFIMPEQLRNQLQGVKKGRANAIWPSVWTVLERAIKRDSSFMICPLSFNTMMSKHHN